MNAETRGPIVLYIAGFGRSGSTVLTNLLGEAEGAFAAGEVLQFWRAMSTDTCVCGCGRITRECSVWEGVRAACKVSQEEANSLAKVAHELWRLRRLPAVALASRKATRGKEFRNLAERAECLYRELARSQRCHVIVDSSKTAAYAHLLRSATNLDVRIVHLVRDARGVAHSWLREKKLPGAPGRYMQRFPLRMSTLTWLAWNMVPEAMWRRRSQVRSGHYQLVRYEDFVRDPRQTAQRILAMVGLENAKLPFLDDRTLELGPNHCLEGNPNRLQHGPIRMNPDEAWLEEMPRRDAWMLSALTSPLLLHYGYPLRPRAMGT